MVDQHKLDFDLLSDQGNAVAKKFGLVFQFSDELRQAYKKLGVDLEKFNGDDSWSLPIPGSFVIDRQGIIRHTNVDVDHTVRPEPAEMVDAIGFAAKQK